MPLFKNFLGTGNMAKFRSLLFREDNDKYKQDFLFPMTILPLVLNIKCNLNLPF